MQSLPVPPRESTAWLVSIASMRVCFDFPQCSQRGKSAPFATHRAAEAELRRILTDLTDSYRLLVAQHRRLAAAIGSHKGCGHGHVASLTARHKVSKIHKGSPCCPSATMPRHKPATVQHYMHVLIAAIQTPSSCSSRSLLCFATPGMRTRCLEAKCPRPDGPHYS